MRPGLSERENEELRAENLKLAEALGKERSAAAARKEVRSLKDRVARLERAHGNEQAGDEIAPVLRAALEAHSGADDDLVACGPHPLDRPQGHDLSLRLAPAARRRSGVSRRWP